MAKDKGKSLERRVQDKQRRSQPPSSPSTVFKAPQNQVPTMKEQQETGYYDPDRELTEPERTPIGGWDGTVPDPSQGRISPPTGDLLKIMPGSAAAKLLMSNSGSLLIRAKDWWNKGRNVRVEGENQARLRDLAADDWAQRGQFGTPETGLKGWDVTRGFRPGVKASEGGFGSGPTPLTRQIVERPIRKVLNTLKIKRGK